MFRFFDVTADPIALSGVGISLCAIGLPWIGGAVLLGAVTLLAVKVLYTHPDTPQPSARGLTLRQLRADVAALGQEVDPTMSAATLLALRNALRA